jgi:integrase
VLEGTFKVPFLFIYKRNGTLSRNSNKLNTQTVKSLQCDAGKESTLSDGEGLYLKATPNLSNAKSCHKTWIFRYKSPLLNKRRTKGLGSYPSISLKQAREKRDAYLRLLGEGLDPNDNNAASAETLTLRQVSSTWFTDKKRPEVTSDFADDIWRSLELHVFPKLGDVPICNIRAHDVYEKLLCLQQSGNLETLRRICSRLRDIMSYAVSRGLVEHNCLYDLSKSFTAPKVVPLPTIRPEELGQFLKDLANVQIQLTTRCQIEWLMLTMVRPAEASAAEWAEINFDKKIWTIPGSRMKNPKKAVRTDLHDHIVPLSEQCLRLLEIMRPISGHRNHVFPGQRSPSNPMNSQSANMVIKRMGYKGRFVSHGFRKLASTYLNEQGFSGDHVEKALAHKDKNAIRAIYNQAEYIEPRRSIMQAWAEFIETSARGKYANLQSSVYS